MLKPGRYKLTKTLSNPVKQDKRQKNIWFKRPFFEEGMQFYVKSDQELIGRSFLVPKGHDNGWQLSLNPPRKGRWNPVAELLIQHLEPCERTLDDLLAICGYSHYIVLNKLVESGQISVQSIEDIIEER